MSGQFPWMRNQDRPECPPFHLCLRSFCTFLESCPMFVRLPFADRRKEFHFLNLVRDWKYAVNDYHNLYRLDTHDVNKKSASLLYILNTYILFCATQRTFKFTDLLNFDSRIKRTLYLYRYSTYFINCTINVQSKQKSLSVIVIYSRYNRN